MLRSRVLLAVLLALPACSAFSPGYLPLGRRNGLPLATSASRTRGTRSGPVMMSDMGDMTMEMMSRLSRNGISELSSQDLLKLKKLCTELSEKVDAAAQSKGPAAKAAAHAKAAASPVTGKSTKPFTIGSPPSDAAEKEAAEFFGIGDDEDEGPLGEDGFPIPKKDPPPKKAPVKTYETKGTQRYSKYVADERDSSLDNKDFATPESLVTADVWEDEYVKVFGSKPPEGKLTHVDELTHSVKPDTGDPYDKVREVQGNPGRYETSEEYYAALNAAIGEWKRARVKAGYKIGADASNAYIEQLAHSAPDSPNYQPWGQKKKFTLDCVLNEIEAQDEKGNVVKLLQFTEVDVTGAASYAGASKGDMLIELNGHEIHSFDDLKAAIADINGAGLSTCKMVVQGPNGIRDLTITGAAGGQ